MNEAEIRERLQSLAAELDAVRLAIKAHIIKRTELIVKESRLVSELTAIILADAGLDDVGKPLTGRNP